MLTQVSFGKFQKLAAHCFGEFVVNNKATGKECPCLRNYFNLMVQQEALLANRAVSLEIRMKMFVSEVRWGLLSHWEKVIEAKNNQTQQACG